MILKVRCAERGARRQIVEPRHNLNRPRWLQESGDEARLVATVHAAIRRRRDSTSDRLKSAGDTRLASEGSGGGLVTKPEPPPSHADSNASTLTVEGDG